ncbi:MAG: hypothetical protein BTN85_1530 [Candidatus Methanohalarchaeum thermophilum]|uniref:Uncharacterized protein n=1 Tax=Methanohalarchaeum thermophilum TaxID=1903181 RepID=A0A1Q6DXC7_METT1|nr:MAG: hypothetical protein BTN85_1530 [Candidatus Methanohalarchaeum thermophilum]
MQETISGVKLEGSWDEVCEETKVMTEVLEKAGHEEDLTQWEKWRPEENESYHDEVRERTVKMASIKKKSIEESEEPIRSKIKQSIVEITKSLSFRDKTERSTEKIKESIKNLLTATYIGSRKLIRQVETTIYKHIMSRTNPQYFDTKSVSASLNQKKKFLKKDKSEYVIKINVNDDKLCKQVQEEFKK